MKKKTKFKSQNYSPEVTTSNEVTVLSSVQDASSANSRFPERSEYLEERKLIIQLKDGASQRFDQILTTLSSGALAFSILVVKDFIKTPDPKLKILLILSWSMWFTSLVSVLISLFLSEQLLSKMLDNTNAVYENKLAKESKLEVVTKYTNSISLITFFLGVVLFLSFIWSNFN